MAPKLRVLISTGQAYPPTKVCTVNSPSPIPIKTPNFEGEISVWVKGYSGDQNGGDGHEYFNVRSSMTYGIVVRGRFLKDVSADDIVFGNVFEKPIRDGLPWGTSIATKFMYFIDPSMEADIYADRPWALSPMLATMGQLSLTKSGTKPPYRPVIEEDALDALDELYEGEDGPPEVEGEAKSQVAARRKWCGSAEHRQGVTLGQDVWVGMEFANGLLDFNTLSATLPQPFHLSIPLLKYWDGQPVTYVCQRRQQKGQPPVGPEGVFFSVAFEIADEEAREELRKRGGDVHSLGGGVDHSPAKEAEKEEPSSDDVD